MDDKEANDLRCYAAEIIVRLWHEKQRGQLDMLGGQVVASLRDLDNDSGPTNGELFEWIAANVGNIDFHVVVPAGVMTTNPWIATGPTFREAVVKAKQQLARAVE